MAKIPAVKVSIGVIVKEGSVLVSQRNANTHCSLLWEFPGGKVSTNERVQVSLSREIFEEVNLSVKKATPLVQFRHQYEERIVIGYVWMVTQFLGLPVSKEGQPIKWVDINDLPMMPMPDANKVIISSLIASTNG